MRWILGMFLSFPILPPSAPEDAPGDLSNWVATEPPAKGGGRWLEANNDAEREWIVSVRDGRPSARLRALKRPFRYPEKQESYPPMPFVVEQGRAIDGTAGEWFSTKVDDGWIIGFNAGEWGGGLWWYSPDGKTRSKISKDQVVGFVPSDSGLLALEGLAHMSMSRGKIIRLAKGADGLWHSAPFVELEGAPEVAAKEADGSLIVATHERLLRVHLDTKRVDVLLDDAFWGGLYPHSMVVAPTGDIYLGMRHGVARVEKRGETYLARWLLPGRPSSTNEPVPGLK